jgi:RNA polymerase sigma factor (TIGR02999 family)
LLIFFCSQFVAAASQSWTLTMDESAWDIMDDVTHLLRTIEKGDARPEQLLPVVYGELRKMASAKMAHESAGHTLQATALVHEAWMRLASSNELGWESREHFFGAAAEAMRRILVDHARKKHAAKRGGGAATEEWDDNSEIVLTAQPDELLAVDDALDELADEDPKAAQLVKLRYFVGMTMDEAADALGMKKRTAEAMWTYARVWLKRAIEDSRDQ